MILRRLACQFSLILRLKGIWQEMKENKPISGMATIRARLLILVDNRQY